MRRWLFRFVAVVLFAAVGTAVWFVFLPDSNRVVYRSETVRRGDLVATVTGTGTLEPEEVIDVGAQVAGLIRSFGMDAGGKPIDYGSPVNAGTVLAHIDDALYVARAEQSRTVLRSAEQKLLQAQRRVDQALSNVKKARADLKQAVARSNQSTRDWNRAKNLRETGSISETEYDAAQSAYEINLAAVDVAEAAIVQFEAGVAEANAAVGEAEAAVATAKAVLLQEEINLGYCTIRSSVQGTIIDRRVTIGQTVQSSFNTPSLFLIAKDLKRMKVWASVNESDIGNIRVGQIVRYTVDAYPAEKFQGTVARIRLNATNTQNVVVYTVEVLTDNPTGKLLPYMTATLAFEVDRRTDVSRVPNAALRYRPANSTEGERELGKAGTVYIEDAGKIRPVALTLGLTDGSYTEVVSGDLPENASVVVGEVRPTTARTTTENPFAPKMPGGGKRQ